MCHILVVGLIDAVRTNDVLWLGDVWFQPFRHAKSQPEYLYDIHHLYLCSYNNVCRFHKMYQLS